MTFSQAVIAALESRGYSSTDIASSLDLDDATLHSVIAGVSELTDEHVLAIENLSGVSIGRLVAMFIEPNGGPATELMAQWDGVFNAELAMRRDRSLSPAAIGSIQD